MQYNHTYILHSPFIGIGQIRYFVYGAIFLVSVSIHNNMELGLFNCVSSNVFPQIIWTCTSMSNTFCIVFVQIYWPYWVNRLQISWAPICYSVRETTPFYHWSQVRMDVLAWTYDFYFETQCSLSVMDISWADGGNVKGY